jgi:hypothetical protein
MKNLILSSLLLLNIFGYAQIKTTPMPLKYEAGVRFNSICCGPPSADFLKNFVKRFNYENKITLQAYQKGGCGKEGEFFILFSLTDAKENVKAAFKNQLQELIPKANEETRLKNPDKGTVQFFNEVNLAQTENCRSEAAAWVYN